jgi:glycosyltransferase domain-containing protein
MREDVAKSTSELTVLLALKGRHLHTLRFLWHANKCRMPYHFLVADGAVCETLAGLLENSDSVFPHLSIEYVRYPDDVDYQAYFRKLSDAASRVRTPYVMQVDNDDFLVQSGVSRCLAFLAANSDFVGISGGIAGFSMRSGRHGTLQDVIGPLERVTFPFSSHYAPRRFEAASVAERIGSDFQGTFALYYCVFRSEAFKTVNNEIAELNMSDLQLYETYLGARAKTLGKARIDPSTVSYIRQFGTSTSQSKYNDWINHLVHSRFSGDFEAMVNYISRAVAEQDGVVGGEYAEEFRQLYADKLRAHLRIHLCGRQRSRLHPITIAKIVASVSPFGAVLDACRRAVTRTRQHEIVRRSTVSRDVNALVRQLISFGATEQYTTAVLQELEDIFDVVQHDDLLGFVAKQAPELL